ncbi:MAG: rRNA-processing protein bfr2 [Watsoniomyces obsoletus]|nr:MAG: rRNA-processing protein bfr2 [Watsoniomyces obsoletus]
MSRRRQPKRRGGQDDVPDIYKEMLAEVTASTPGQSSNTERPIKRRKTAHRAITERTVDTTSRDSKRKDVEPRTPTDRPEARLQTEESEESDIDWEEVDLDINHASDQENDEDEPENGAMDLVLNEEDTPRKSRAGPTAQALNAEQRRLRLDVHRMHLLCLLTHVGMRNRWCNNRKVQATLKPLLSQRTVSYLNPNPNFSQFQRSRSFMDGLAQASEAWKGRFMKTARGLHRASWRPNHDDVKHLIPHQDYDEPLEKDDFIEIARTCRASRDVGAQLFCALLRAVGVKTRLVCSLQVLPFGSSTVKALLPQKSNPTVFVSRDESSGSKPAWADSPKRTSTPPPLVPRVARRLNEPMSDVKPGVTDLGIPPVVKVPKKFKESAYPVYWVEAFNEALQRWIPVDPLVTLTVAKASKLEPPASDSLNQMSYVMALEADGVARDVTRRYVKAYNGKTRRSRIESTPGGSLWWTGVLNFYGRRCLLDRDQVEEAELEGREAQEPLPRNVQDFKDHPRYALERHLRKNQVIHPKKEMGRLSTGKTGSASKAKKGLEPIYRRRDVHTVRSADGWYRLGRDVKPGEQPLKHAAPRRKKGRSMMMMNDEGSSDTDGNAEKGLYAEFQTKIYEAPPIINGRVLKNPYGNLDIYVPSMVPKGGVHITDSQASRAARLLGIDYADAVTGFEFKGRQGNPVIRGIVTAVEYQAAIAAVIQGFRDEEMNALAAIQSYECLQLWKRFLIALRVHERIGEYDVEGGGDDEDDGGSLRNIQTAEEDDEDEDEARGGFFPDRFAEDIAQPTAGHIIPIVTSSGMNPEVEDSGGGGFMMDDLGDSINLAYRGEVQREKRGGGGKGRFLESERQLEPDPAMEREEVGGGFLPEPLDDGLNVEEEVKGGGGFLPEDTTTITPMTGPDNNNGDKNAVRMKAINLVSRTQEEDDPSQDNESRKTGRDMDAAGLKHDNTNLGADAKDGEEEGEEEADHQENQSLISHDPEDEDAEMEWLVSD